MLESLLIVFYVVAVAGRLSSFVGLGVDAVHVDIFDRLMTKILWIAVYVLLVTVFLYKKRKWVIKKLLAIYQDLGSELSLFIRKYLKFEYFQLAIVSLIGATISSIFAYKVKHGLIGVAYYAVLISIPFFVKHIWNPKIQKVFYKVIFLLNLIMLVIAYIQFKTYFQGGEEHPFIRIFDSYGGFMPLSFFRLEHDGILYLRPSALMIDPNYLAIFAGFAVVFAYEHFRIIRNGNFKRWRKAGEIFLSLLGFASAIGLIVISGSRTGFIVLAVSTVSYWAAVLLYRLKRNRGKRSSSARKKSPIKLASVSVFDMLTNIKERFIGAITLQDESARQHLVLAKIGLEIFKRFPFLGIGIGSYTFYYQDYFDVETLGATPHNAYIRVLAELGIVGFMWFSGFVIYFAKKALSKRSPLLISLLAGILIGNMFQDFFMTPWNWFLLGLFLIEEY
ncbi:hypothetical protein GF357_03045 [Candidatus Dojkabacteria bacterium]|nr:hypothetical protein [Candidatus Dojkabacteria bacterium]